MKQALVLLVLLCLAGECQPGTTTVHPAVAVCMAAAVEHAVRGHGGAIVQA